MNNIIFIILVFSLTILLLTILPIPQEKDFYAFHVSECEQVHAKNLTFAVCSGFVYPPNESDFKNPCAIHPLESCKDNVAHGSNTGQTELRPLLNIFDIHIEKR